MKCINKQVFLFIKQNVNKMYCIWQCDKLRMHNVWYNLRTPYTFVCILYFTSFILYHPFYTFFVITYLYLENICSSSSLFWSRAQLTGKLYKEKYNRWVLTFKDMRHSDRYPIEFLGFREFEFGFSKSDRS